MVDHVISVAKRWYNEERGRTNGNTKAWEDLSHDQKLNIIDSVMDTVETMEEAWRTSS